MAWVPAQTVLAASEANWVLCDPELALPSLLVRLVLAYEGSLVCFSISVLEFARCRRSKLEVSLDLRRVLFRRGKSRGRVGHAHSIVFDRTGRVSRVRGQENDGRPTMVLFRGSPRGGCPRGRDPQGRRPTLLYADSQFSATLCPDPDSRTLSLTRTRDGASVAFGGPRVRLCRVLGTRESFKLAELTNECLKLYTVSFDELQRGNWSDKPQVRGFHVRGFHVVGLAAIESMTLVHLASGPNSLVLLQIGQSELVACEDSQVSLRGVTGLEPGHIVVGVSAPDRDLLLRITAV